jgi:hypothetical protein
MRKKSTMEQIFSKYDKDGDGQLDQNEINVIASDLKNEKKQRKLMAKGAMAMCGIVTLVLVANAGLTAGIVYLAKDTAVKNGKLVDPETDEPLMVNSAETNVAADGTLRGRSSDKIIATASALQSQTLDSRLPDSAWDELKYIDVRNDNGGSVHLFVQAFTRVPSSEALHGSFVKIHSTIGTISLDGDLMTFHDSSSTRVFSEAKFAVTPSGRRLAGIIYLLGFFNQIPSFEGWNNTYDTPPKIPHVFFANASLMYACAYQGINLCDDAGVGAESRTFFLNKLWTVTRLDMWADLNTGIGKEVYWYMAGNPGWSFEKQLDLTGKKEHVMQTWQASNEAYFCRTTPQPQYLSTWLSAQSAASSRASYKGEVDLEGDGQMLHHFQIKPTEAEHVSLDFYAHLIGEGEVLPAYVQLRIGTFDTDDENVRFIAYKFDHFEKLQALPAEGSIFDQSGSTVPFEETYCASTLEYTNQSRLNGKIHVDNMIVDTDPLSSPLARTSLRYVFKTNPTWSAAQVVAWEDQLWSNHSELVMYRLYLDADSPAETYGDVHGRALKSSLTTNERRDLSRLASELSMDTDKDTLAMLLNRLNGEMDHRDEMPWVSRSEFTTHMVEKMAESNMGFHGRALTHQCGRRQLAWDQEFYTNQTGLTDVEFLDPNALDSEASERRRKLCDACGYRRRELSEHERRLCHTCACPGCTSPSSSRCNVPMEVETGGFPFNFMRAVEDYDRGKKNEKALIPCDISMGYPTPCKGTVSCAIDDVPLCCGGIVHGTAKGSGSWDCANDFSSCEATIAITGEIGAGVPKCKWCPDVMSFSITYSRTMGVQACCTGPFAYTKDEIKLEGTFVGVVVAELKGALYEAAADDTQCRTSRPNYIENDLRQLVVSGAVKICFLFCFSIVSGNVFMAPGAAKQGGSHLGSGSCCDWVTEWASRSSCAYCPGSHRHTWPPSWTPWGGSSPGCWSSRKCS